MSGERASERLRELEILACGGNPHAGLWPLRDALPEIIAAFEASEALSRFLEHEKETTEPCAECVSKGLVAGESMRDYDTEEKLSEKLALALDALASKLSGEGQGAEGRDG